MKEKIEQFVKDKRDELIQITSELIEANTVNPPGNEGLATDICIKYFDKYDIPWSIFSAEDDRPNIIGKIGKGGPKILIACHLDVVPAGEGWETDPFKAVVKDGNIYGRGSTDNKGPAASMIIAGAFLKSIEDQLNCEVWLAGVADEERGSALGVDYLVKEGLVDVDYAIVPDVAMHNGMIDVAEKGAFFAEITSYGRQCHGSRPYMGVNAIWNMIHLLNKIKTMEIPYKKHPHLTPPTINLGMIEGGNAPNMVPAQCKASIDIRHLPGTTGDDIKALLQSKMTEAEAETDGKFEINVIQDLPPTEVPDDAPLVKAMIEATADAIGVNAEPGGMFGATVVKQFLQGGVTAVGCGPGDMETAHTANESAPIDELVDFAAILCHACLKAAKLD